MKNIRRIAIYWKEELGRKAGSVQRLVIMLILYLEVHFWWLKSVGKEIASSYFVPSTYR
ncbi:uncharacterized protein FOMMEDRAFT_164111 [Fomitiporia mediterranea MF3/22]|uniref:Uncharacterized protein n=1 Tax=Fomitiporia mediterranea (strain MF3/22) TaxID=694068 RepID=R7SG87_FOMME|nr:uncharacterized protein FOMMEDRAFT_164111 [Fomitiporia mediterranea MF3/22]EJC97287.1 hypothetical protein FOMMEDRAFT_164111 [Fomitiporia mediterranea MF3/22]